MNHEDRRGALIFYAGTLAVTLAATAIASPGLSWAADWTCLGCLTVWSVWEAARHHSARRVKKASEESVGQTEKDGLKRGILPDAATLLVAAWGGWCLSVSGAGVSSASILVFPGLVLVIAAARRSATTRRAAVCGMASGLVCCTVMLSWMPEAFSWFTDSGRFEGLMLALPVLALSAARYSLLFFVIRMAREYRFEWGGIVAAAGFVVIEKLFLSVTPDLLSYRLFPLKPLMQGADLFGALGMGFFLVLVCYWCVLGIGTVRPFRLRLQPVAAAACLLAAWTGYGAWRLAELNAVTRDAPKIAVGMVQANTNSHLHMTAGPAMVELAKAIVRVTERLADSAPRPALIVFAEATAPMGFESGVNSLIRTAYRVAARQSGIPLVVDNIGYRRATADSAAVYWRESLLLDPKGEIAGTYRKRALFPIGETLPGARRFPVLQRLFPRGSSFLPGHKAVIFSVENFRVAPVVCFEILYPGLVRQPARNGADLLVNPGNDAWFRSLKEKRQHLWGATFRAVENRVPLVRAANTGISAFIDQAGRVVRSSPCDIPWRGTQPVAIAKIFSLYRAGGYRFPYLCLGICLAAITQAGWRRGRSVGWRQA